MILQSALGLSLVLNVALSTEASAPDQITAQQPTFSQRDATLLPLVQRATQCIVRRVTMSPKYRAAMPPDQINELIVEVIPDCGRSVRAMMDMHDRLYGNGSGEAFLLGPYLDVLPSAVIAQARAHTR